MCKKEKHVPTVAAVLRHKDSREYLLIHPKKNCPELAKNNPGIVKGGIKRGEGILTALYRELEEEIFVTTEQLVLLGYGGSRSVRSVRRKRGLYRKRYFFFLLEYQGPHELVVGEELSAYSWLGLEEVHEEIKVLLQTRVEKHAALQAVFQAVEGEQRTVKKKRKACPRKKAKKNKKQATR